MGAWHPSKNGPNASTDLQNKIGAFIHSITISSKFDAKLLYSTIWEKQTTLGVYNNCYDLITVQILLVIMIINSSIDSK